MKRTYAISLAVAVFLACGLSWTHSRPLPDQKAKLPDAFLKNNPAFAKGEPQTAPAILDVKLPGHLGTIIQEVDRVDPDLVEVLNLAFRQNPVPTSRLAAFSMFDTPDYRVDGWAVRVQDIEDVREGIILKLQVGPLVSSVFGASTCVLSDGVIEWYRLDAAGLHRLRSELPAGKPLVSGVIVD